MPPTITPAHPPAGGFAHALPGGRGGGACRALVVALAPLALMLSGCGAGGEGLAPAAKPALPPQPTAAHPAPALNAAPLPPIQVQQLPGVAGVIGADAATLIRMFGKPRLDVREGDTRKLQFVGQPCVLDIYLYPLSPGGRAGASFVNARRRGDGRAVDRAACITLLRQP